MMPLDEWLAFKTPGGTGSHSAIAALSPHLPCDRLFAVSKEAVLIVDVATLAIVRVNPPAAMLFHTTRARMVGTKFLSSFEESSATEILRCLALTQTAGSADAAAVRPRSGGVDLKARLSLIRSAAASFMLVRLAPNDALRFDARGASASVVLDAIEAAPVGFLIADSVFRIDYANQAFVDMIEAQSQAELRADSLMRWLRLTPENLRLLRVQLAQRQAATLLTAYLHPYRARPRRVEVCAVPVPDGDQICWGFTVRTLPRFKLKIA